jgi:hypothetical protein
VGDVLGEDGNKVVGGKGGIGKNVPVRNFNDPRIQPPTWFDDADYNACMCCSTEFTLFNRRHHCRGCKFCYVYKKKDLIYIYICIYMYTFTASSLSPHQNAFFFSAFCAFCHVVIACVSFSNFFFEYFKN